MKEMALEVFCEKKSQSEAARIMGVTQGAVSQMISSEREIYFVIDGEQTTYYEIKRPKNTAA